MNKNWVTEKKKVTEVRPEKFRTGSKKEKSYHAEERKMRDAVRHLKLKFPDLIPILSMMPQVPVMEHVGIATDGLRLLFSPDPEKEISNVEDEILHILCHGLLGHFEMTELYGESENVAWLMDFSATALENRMKGRDVSEYLAEMNGQVAFPHKLYMECIETGMKPQKLMKVEEKFLFVREADDHAYWYPERKPAGDDPNGGGASKDGNGAGESGKKGIGKSHRTLADLKEIKEFWGKARESAFGKSDISQDPVLVSDMNRQYGSGSADMHRTASKRISDVLSYREILRDFFHRAEEKYEDHELIDQMLYHYGLELYGDVPLVEPSEEGTRREIDTIVIAVDTSGSCFDDSLDQFLLETEQMLKDLCALGDIPKVVMLQCDAEITKEVVIHGEEELGRYCEMEDFTGGGGTDFRPVFERIEEMEKTGEKVGALFYFTDGCGAYPEKKRENSYFIMKPEVFDEMTGKPMISGFPEWVHPIMLRK